MLIPMQKNFLISTIIFKSNGNDYLNLAFFSPERCRNGPGTVRKKLVTMRERPGTERVNSESNFENHF